MKKNLRKLITKRKRHICSVKGCGNLNTTLVSRSADLYGALYLCDECISELHAKVFEQPEQSEQSEQKAPEQAEQSEQLESKKQKQTKPKN